MIDRSAPVAIVGAGHAGGSAAALLRQYGWLGQVILIGAEPVLPYQRPPLSKAWLKGESALADVLLRPAAFYQNSRIDVRLGCSVTAIDRPDKAVVLSSGQRIGYAHLILATGSQTRSLVVPGCEGAGVFSLRTLAEAEALRAALRPGVKLAIVGAGYIGLEVAASACRLGVDVVVIEREPRVLPRVASAPLADFFQRRHVAAGVRIRLNAAVEAFECVDGRVSSIRLSDGETVPCDCVVVGIGATPNDTLGRSAGLDCANGIVVQDAALTSDSAIHAIGDCTYRPLPLYARSGRLESVPNALEQAKQAAAYLCGRPQPAPEAPFFWSDQYDVRLQIAGLAFDVTEVVVRGDPQSRSFAIFHLAQDGRVQAVEAVNAPAEFMAGRAMIARRKQAVASRLRDVSCSIRELAA